MGMSSLGSSGQGSPGDESNRSVQKREIRLIKNREAARECRRKKKEYIKCLENRVQVLEAQNNQLIEELQNLKAQYVDRESSSENDMMRVPHGAHVALQMTLAR